PTLLLFLLYLSVAPRYLHSFPTRRSSDLLDLPELVDLYAEFDDMPIVSISDSQREPLPRARWLATVHHGLPADLYSFHGRPGDYLAFLGRVSPEKGLPDAIEIANRVGMRLN